MALNRKDTQLTFNDLPFDLRDLIWERTLLNTASSTLEIFLGFLPRLGRMSFVFHLHHPQPTALQICRESRGTALRRGFFFPSSRAGSPGQWFDPETDIVYLDSLSWYLAQVAGIERVHHVGLKWGSFFYEVPRDDEIPPRQDWKVDIASLRTDVPRMQTLNYILPQVLLKNPGRWGKEPDGAEKFEARLVVLPEEARIPWKSLFVRSPEYVKNMNHPAAWLHTWRDVRRDIKNRFKEGSTGEETASGFKGKEEETDVTKQSDNPPTVFGWLLLRTGMPTETKGGRRYLEY